MLKQAAFEADEVHGNASWKRRYVNKVWGGGGDGVVCMATLSALPTVALHAHSSMGTHPLHVAHLHLFKLAKVQDSLFSCLRQIISKQRS